MFFFSNSNYLPLSSKLNSKSVYWVISSSEISRCLLSKIFGFDWRSSKYRFNEMLDATNKLSCSFIPNKLFDLKFSQMLLKFCLDFFESKLNVPCPCPMPLVLCYFPAVEYLSQAIAHQGLFLRSPIHQCLGFLHEVWSSEVVDHHPQHIKLLLPEVMSAPINEVVRFYPELRHLANHQSI